MSYKISYPNKWDKNGTHFDQLVTITIDRYDLLKICFRKTVLVMQNEKWYDRAQNLHFHTRTNRNKLAEIFGFKNDPRFLDRNTAFKYVVL